MIEDYLIYHNKYTKLYGDKTIVLYENGSFFEIFRSVSIENNLQKISKILDIIHKHTFFESMYDCIGWPTVANQKFINKLVDNDYIVVLVKIVERNIQYNIIRREATNIYFPLSYYNENKIEDKINDNTVYI